MTVETFLRGLPDRPATETLTPPLGNGCRLRARKGKRGMWFELEREVRPGAWTLARQFYANRNATGVLAHYLGIAWRTLADE